MYTPRLFPRRPREAAREAARASATVLAALGLVLFAVSVGAQATTDGPYKVLKTLRVGGEGGFDYITTDVVNRRLYIPRGGTRAIAATDSSPARPAVPGRITIWDLDTFAPLGEVANTGGNGVALDHASGHGFSSSKPVSMFDIKTQQLIKTIDVGAAQPDGIAYEPVSGKIFVFSHPTKDAIVIDPKDGTIVATVDLGGVPEQSVSDGKGLLYVVMQDAAGSVTVVDTKSMKAIAHYPLGDKGGCNGLALDLKNQILFAACARSGAGAVPNPPAGPPQPAQPMMVVLSAKDGKILANLPLAGGSDGVAFNPNTMEAFSTHGNGTLTVVKETSPTSFEVVQNLQTMNGARPMGFDSKTGRIITMSVERGPAPPPPAGGGRGGAAPVIPGSFTILVIGRP